MGVAVNQPGRPARTRAIFTIALSLVGATRLSADDATLDWTAARARVAPSVVKIGVTDAEGVSRIRGAGFFVTRGGVVATCRRNFRDGDKGPLVVLSDGTTRSIQGVRAADPANALVLLATSATDTPTLDWGTSATLTKGDPVALLGDSDAYLTAMSSGRYLGRKDLLGIDGFLETTAAMQHGWSGCPLFDALGRLVGLGAARHDWKHPSGLAIPVERLSELVNSLPSSTSVRPFGKIATFLDALEWDVETSTEFDAAVGVINGGGGERAVRAMRTVVARYPGSALALGGLAGAYATLGQDLEAMETFRRAITIRPRYAYLWGWLANTLARLGRPAESALAYRRTFDLEGRDLSKWPILDGRSLDRGNNMEVIVALGVATSWTLPSYKPDVEACLALTYADAGLDDQANAVVERLRAEHPDVADRLAAEITKRAK